MKQKLIYFILAGLLEVIYGYVYADSEHYEVEYFKDPDIYVYSPKEIEADSIYPVLYLIHGQSQTPLVWEQMGLTQVLNELYESGEIIPFYIVLAHDVNCFDDMYQSGFYRHFVKEIMPFVEELFPVDTSGDNTAIGGISHGAQWAQFIGLNEYGRFGSIGLHSPANPFFSRTNLYRIIQENKESPKLRIRIDIGAEDVYVYDGSKISQQLVEIIYPHEFVLGQGGHDLEYWSKNLPEYLKWYSEGFCIRKLEYI